MVGVDNLNQAYDVRLKEWRLKQLLPHQVFSCSKRTSACWIDRGCFQQAGPLDGSSTWRRGPGYAPVWKTVDLVNTNVTGTLNTLEMCRRYQVPKYILASTSSIYGADAPLPTPESADSDRPLQPYSASKKGAEALAHAYHFLHGVDVTVFRYFTVYGPAGRPDMVMFRFTQWISEGRPVRLNGDGEQSRGFTYVDDIARGTILGLKPVGYEIINLGGHETITINEMIRELEGLTGCKAQVERYPAHPADMLANWADVEKARRMLGWEPQVSLQEGMRRLVEWYQAEREWASQVLTHEIQSSMAEILAARSAAGKGYP